jgi:hypothetical protein
VPSDLAAAAAKVQKAINDLRAAQVSGNFTAQGQALDALDAAVKEFEAVQAKLNSPTPKPGASRSG